MTIYIVMLIFLMRRPFPRTCILITATYLALWGCFTVISHWNQPPPLPVSANLPSLITNAPSAFTITALPVNFEANAVNSKGEIAGTWDTHENFEISKDVSNAAVWYQEKMRRIPRLGDASVCAGKCLSDNGWLGGSAGNIFVDPYQDPSCAVVWNAGAKNAPVHWQGQLPNLSRDTVLSVNTRSQAVGTSSAAYPGEMGNPNIGPPFPDVTRAFFWDGQTMQDLGEGEACGINENGQIVGTQNKKIVLWQNNRSYVLGNGKGYAINNRGQIVGTLPFETKKPPEQQFFGSVAADDESTAPAFHAMLWDKGAVKDLGALVNGWNSRAVAINDRGQIVGNSVYSKNWKPEDARAFVWQSGKMVDLNTLISKRSGWVLCEARSINNKGWIVGNGNLHGESRSFLLVPK